MASHPSYTMRFTLLLTGISTFVLIGCSNVDVAKDPATDPSCVVYFDGCNTCTKMGGGIGCTKKACEPGSMEKPYCMEFVKN